jgi:carbonic anhydrase/acetyltransferase-like protein (isoleucine patch superfamily)
MPSYAISSDATVRSFGSLDPVLADGVVVLDGARIIGDVTLADGVSIWYNTVIRGDVHWVRIGCETNVQDNSVLHVTHDRYPLSIGERVTVGHAARLHGCTIHDESLIGIAATVLDSAVVESHAMVAAGAVVPPGMVVKSGTLVAGVPAKVIRTLRDDEISYLPESAARYRRYAASHAAEMANI